MHKLTVIFIFLCFKTVFSQDLENRIYKATETFNTLKTDEALNLLNLKSDHFKSELKTEDEHFAFINLLLNKAYYLNQKNRQQKAISTYEMAWTRYKKEKIAKVFRFDIIEYCLIPLGVLYHKTNNYTNAENTIKHYIFLATQQKQDKHLASGAINLSNLYQKLGRHQLAIDVATNGLQLKKLSKQQKTKLKAIQSTSKTRLHKPSYNRDKTVVLKQLPNSLDSHTNIELEYQWALKEGNYTKALNKFNRIKSSSYNNKRTPRASAKLNIEEAHLYFMLNDKKTASKKLKTALYILLPGFKGNALPEVNDLYPENTFIDLFDALAQLQTNPENALKCYDLSFYTSSLLTDEVTSQEGQLIVLADNRKRSEHCIDLLKQLNNTANNTSFIERAFSYAETFKASILKENISKKDLLKAHPKDSLLIKEQYLLKKQEQLTNQLIKTPHHYNETEATNTLRETLNTVSIALKAIKKSIAKKYNTLEPHAISFTEIKKKLQKDNATLVEYFYGNNSIYQFIITQESTQLNTIDLNNATKNSLFQFINYFENASVINNDVSKYSLDAFTLYNTLLLDRISDKQNLVIIPDGFINFIPIDALLTSKTKSTHFENMPFVVKSHNIAYNSSASLYLKEDNPPSNLNVLGVFPVFKNTKQELSFSIHEAESIKKEMKSKVLMHALATKENFINAANNYSILHLSTHAQSGDFIKPASIEFSKSSLQLNELYALDLNCNLVILSACETGVGKLKTGEGAMSIARGFQYAGIDNLLFSLWNISDLSTSQIMGSFYNNYSEYKSAFVANRQSKLEYLENRSIKNIKKSPYYWSAFVYYGSLTAPVKTTNKYVFIIGLSLLITVFLLLAFKTYNGRHA